MNTRTDTILAMILQGPLKNHRLLLVASGSFQHVALCTFSLHVCLPLISVPLIPEECATPNVPSPRGLAPVWVHLRRRSPTEGLTQLSHAPISANTFQRSTHRKVVPPGAHTHTRQLSAFASEENYIIIIVIIILCVIMPVMPIHAGATPESPAGFLPRTSKPR